MGLAGSKRQPNRPRTLRSSLPLLLAVAALGCSDTPTGIRAVVFHSSLNIDLDTFVETPSGLFYKDEVPGIGILAEQESIVSFTLEGWRPDGENILPLETWVNYRLDGTELPPGVDEALRGMRVGGLRAAVLPPDLGLGQGQVLVVRITLTSVQ